MRPTPDEVERLFGLVEREVGTPDVVVYNASARARGAFVDLVPADVAQAIAVSGFGGFLVAQQAAKRMLPNKHGAILFTGASASVKGYAQSAPFAMGKFALRGLAQSMARELSPQGIHVAHFVIDGGIRSRPASSLPTGRIRCSIPTRLRRATGTCCSSRRAHGPGNWNCAPGSRSFEGSCGIIAVIASVSEAIQEQQVNETGLLRRLAPRNDEGLYAMASSARCSATSRQLAQGISSASTATLFSKRTSFQSSG